MKSTVQSPAGRIRIHTRYDGWLEPQHNAKARKRAELKANIKNALKENYHR